MDKFLETVERLWENPFVQALVYLVVAILAGIIASVIVKWLFKLMKLDKKLDKWGVNEGQSGTATKFIGKLTFLIVFLLFLPAVLGALGLDSVSKPIGDFASTFINYLPNIIAAAVLIFVGIFVGQILSQVVTILLAKTKIDNLSEKFAGGKKSGEDGDDSEESYESSGSSVKLSVIIGKIINALVVLIAIVQALTILNIEAISAPALSIIETVFGAIPKVILAALVIAFGLVIANLVCSLLGNLLTSVNFDGMITKMLPQAKENFSAVKLITNIVRVVIIFFIVAQGVEILGLEMLTGIMATIISYLPMVIKAIVIALVAFLGANLVESVMQKSMPGSSAAARILKTIIYVVAVFMILSQLEFATTIVNYAFIIALSALGVAFAIAFGIGGRDFAKKTLENVNLSKDNSQNSVKGEEEKKQ